MDNCDGNVPQPEIEIAELVERARKGDTSAFGQIYDYYADRIYRHILYRTGNMEDARDLMQEVFIKAWKGLPRYNPTRTPFAGWLFTIAHNRVIDHYRTRKDCDYIEDESIIISMAGTPEKLAEQNFTQLEVRKAILKLPPEQQQVILMKFIEGFEYSEISSAVQKSETNIRVIVHRALKKMQQILAATGYRND